MVVTQLSDTSVTKDKQHEAVSYIKMTLPIHVLLASYYCKMWFEMVANLDTHRG